MRSIAALTAVTALALETSLQGCFGHYIQSVTRPMVTYDLSEMHREVGFRL